MRCKIIAIWIFIVTSYVLYLNGFTIKASDFPIYNHVIQSGFSETSAYNLVTSIYLNYRYYDTLFEALLLIISVIAVIYLSVHKEHYHE